MRNGRRLPTREDHAVKSRHLRGSSNSRHRSANLFECDDVFTDIALQGEYANACHYQPRSAKRVSSVAVSKPFIAAPRPVDTRATTLASW